MTRSVWAARRCRKLLDMVAEFMSRAREILAGGVTEESLQAVGRLLSTMSEDERFVPETEMRSLHGGDSSFSLLQSDPDGLTLMLARFSPAEETPVHDHNSWGVACVIRGADSYRHWTVGDDGRVKILYEKELRPKDFITWLDPPHDIHSQRGIGEEALELVLFGKNVMTIPRRYYDPRTGDVRTALPQ
jgi:predicted metal-dependent enzyme (double-stranded beta helix superfamily)